MSRGRRDVRKSFTTLLVLGSMMMTLLVFSLLTKIRPVSLANAQEHGPARNAATRPKANKVRKWGCKWERVGTKGFSLTCACGDGCRQRTTYRSDGARREPNGSPGPLYW